MKKENTTATPNALLNDTNLSAGEKITYILLMKYERFEKNNSGSFFTWSKDYMKRDTAKKYLSSLLAKEYIDENNNFYYFEDGEKKDYNGQSFSTTFKTISFFPVKEELLFAKSNGRSLTPEQKLFLIFFDRDRCDTRQGWKPHFNTYESFGLKRDAVKKIIKALKEKNIISYEVKHYGNENKCLKQTYINKIKISFLGDEIETAEPVVEEVKPVEENDNIDYCSLLDKIDNEQWDFAHSEMAQKIKDENREEALLRQEELEQGCLRLNKRSEKDSDCWSIWDLAAAL